MEIELLNTKEELVSFPLDGTIQLKSNKLLEDSSLHSSISIFRLTDEQGLFNFGDKYNQSIGYVRETFNTIPFTITQVAFTQGYLITLTPNTKLHPGSNYGLFIDKNLSSEFIAVTKPISKSASVMEAEVLNPSLTSPHISTIEVTSNPVITKEANILACTYTSGSYIQNFRLNLKSSNTSFEVLGITYKFQDMPYVSGEKFEVLIEQGDTLPSNLIYELHTSLTQNNIQIPLDQDSKRLSNQDILDYYETQDKLETEEVVLPPDVYIQEDGIQYKYFGYNKILITFPTKEHRDDVNLLEFDFEVSEAFDNFTLEQYGYYNPEAKYEVKLSPKNDTQILVEIKEVK